MAPEDDINVTVDEADILRGRQVLDVGCGGGLLSEVRSNYTFIPHNRSIPQPYRA